MGTVANLDEESSGRPTAWQTVDEFEAQQRINATVSPAVFRREAFAGGPLLNLRFTRAHGAFLVNADFRFVDLFGADFSEAILQGSIWTDYGLSSETGVRWTAATLDCADFTNADLRGADLRGCPLHFADLAFAAMRHTSLSEAALAGADCQAIDLSDARADSTDFSGANLNRAIAKRVNFQEAVLFATEAQFVDFRGSDFSGADLRSAHLGSSNFTQCRLKAADLSRAVLNGAKFINADLSGAIFTNCKSPRANFSGAIVDATTVLPAGLDHEYFRVALSGGRSRLQPRGKPIPKPAVIKPGAPAGSKDPKHPATPFQASKAGSIR